MSYIDKSCSEFAEILAAGTPVPGGGSAAALAGAVGTALGNMVGSLTTGKKKYAHVEDHMYALMEKAAELRVQLLELVDKDAEAFEPLAKAYGMPKDTPEQREEKVLPLIDALRKMTLEPAKVLGLDNKGIIKVGADADITVFNPDTIIDGATFQDLHIQPEGIDYVFIGGKMATEGKTTVNGRLGRFISYK